MLRCTDSLPEALYTAAQVRELDRIAIEQHGIPGIQLMRRAGRAAFALLQQRWPSCEQLHIFCGGGNNGGDGYIVAALASERGYQVQLHCLSDPQQLSGAAADAYAYARQAGADCRPWREASALGTQAVAQTVVIDALLGTGLKGDPRPHYRSAIEAINTSGLPVMALDIPSGLCSDSGRALGCAVAADCTVTFIGMKRGLLTGDAADHTGELYYSDLQVPPAIFTEVEVSARQLQLEPLQSLLPARKRSAHKGHFGHVLVVGGDTGMAGAVTLAASAAARCGAGLVSCATRPQHVAVVVSQRPEVMAHGIDHGQQLDALLQRASTLVIGPGLGRGPWAEQMLQRALASTLPLVIDADALNLLAATDCQPRDNWILTPHPGEAARLLDTDTVTIQQDRFAAAQALQQRYGGTVILKGAGSLIASSEGVTLSAYGNPGMATGGMGDVLSGILGALLAQQLTPLQAAQLGVCLHGRAADLAAADGERGMLAADLLPWLRQLVNP